MDILYDDKYHLHLGYYEDNCDYESIAFKRKYEDIWDIFFDFKGYGLENITSENETTLEPFGTRIFSISNKEVDYDIGVQKFRQWLSINKII
ncbi:DUF3986 family protein [Neobacillus sp. MER 74]|uniref:DUF3986 family protein n=1 Tax=Neobacillus sp. MER 74 TaxID=2939566 RepID=UPI00203AA058|nr:DUF3986 family protein [Neobacillus sp. MER 74]MCM3118002.1 DUF3986 family protein [Neobacillus sp. MER 74]